MLGAGLYLALEWVPSRDVRKIDKVPTFISAFEKPGKMLNREEADLLTIVGWTLVVLGVTQLAAGSVRRDGVIRFCDTCNMQVNTTKRLLRLRCERCGGKVHK